MGSNPFKNNFCRCIKNNDTEEFELNQQSKNEVINENEIKDYFNADLRVDVASQGNFSIVNGNFIQEADAESIQTSKSNNRYNLHNVDFMSPAKTGKVSASFTPKSSMPLEIINEQNGEGNTLNTQHMNNVSHTHHTRKSSVHSDEKSYHDHSRKKHIFDPVSKSADVVSRNKNLKLVDSDEKLNKLRNFDIFKNNLDSQKLLKMKRNDIILHGELFKLSTEKSIEVQSYAYTSKFCILTKSEFKYYNSKESYLHLMKPNLTFPLHSISEINFLNESFLKNIFIKKLNIPKENGQIYHLYLKVLKNSSSNSNNINSLNVTSRTHKTDSSKNINLETSGANFFTSSFKSHNKGGDKFKNLLIFASPNLNHINTWISVIDFLITNKI